MRLITAFLFACLPAVTMAQVPGTVGPPPDSRMSPGSEGPTLACRLFDLGCKRAPEPEATPVVAEQKAAAPAATKRKAKPAAKAKVKTEPAPAPDDE